MEVHLCRESSSTDMKLTLTLFFDGIYKGTLSVTSSEAIWLYRALEDFAKKHESKPGIADLHRERNCWNVSSFPFDYDANQTANPPGSF